MASFTATLVADTLIGGDGNDLFIIASAEHAAEDLITGGGGTDEVRFTSTAPDGETLFLDPDCEVELVTIGTGTAAAAVATGTQGHDVIASAMSTAVRINGNAGANMLVGGSASDSLFGGAGGDMLFGGEGDDRLEGGAGADVLDGEAGSDTYVVSMATDFTAADVIADTGDDGDTDILEIRTASGVIVIGVNLAGIERINIVGATPTSAAGVALSAAVTFGSQIFGNAAANAIGGGSGFDFIEGGAGGDSMTGGAGDDFFIVKLAAHATGDKYVGGVGTDTVAFTPETQQAGAAAIMVVGAGSTGIENFRVMGEGAHGINAAILGATAGARFIGNDAANTLIGGAGNDVFSGGDGNDSLVGGAGFDQLDFSDFDIVGVNANLATGISTGVETGNDVFSGIEGLIGSTYDDVLTGSALANRIEGLDGADTITGGAGADTMIGAFGEDVFVIAQGSHGLGDVILGGEGDFDWVEFTSTLRGDTLTVRAAWSDVEFYVLGASTGTTALNINAVSASEAVILLGNNGTNILTGSVHGDAIDGGAGSDLIDGRGGADSLWGGDGIDRLYGGAGNDVLNGGAGNDRLDGGSGFDLVDFSSEVSGGSIDLNLQSVVLGATTDTLVSIEYVVGSAGDNSMTGTAASELLDGSAGNDTLFGGLGNDTLIGGDGTDLLSFAGGAAVVVNLATGTASGQGSDSISEVENVFGTAFADSITGNFLANRFWGGAGNDTLNGGSGFDTVDYGLEGAAVTVNLTTGTASGATMGTDSLAAMENVVDTAFDDSITGSGAGNRFTGGAGNDTLNGAGGIDTVDYSAAGAGVTVNLTAGTASGASTGTDSLTLIENIVGSGFADTITGSSGGNLFFAGAGDDALDGAGGIDTVDYSLESAGVFVDLAAGKASGDSTGIDTLVSIEQVVGSGFDDLITRTAGVNPFILTLTGGAGNDTLIGGADFDLLIGGTGNDSLDGGFSIDILDYSNEFFFAITVNLGTGLASGTGIGNDTLAGLEWVYGTNFNDVIIGDLGDNQLSGNEGNDSLDGAAGNDALEDFAGDDTLAGGAGDDWIVAGAGADSVSGGNGNDSILASAGDGNDSYNGGADSDTLEYAAEETGAITVDLASGVAGGAAGNDTLSGIENVLGAGGNDTLMGSSEENDLEGMGGNDSINGGAGFDQLYGHDGNDTLMGGEDVDLLIGGDGNDLFAFDQVPNGIFDQIVDFVSGSDKFQLDNTLFAGALAASTGGVLNAGAFRAATDFSSGGSAKIILYETDTGRLYYDFNADGNIGSAPLFAQVTGNPTLSASDFLVIA